MSYEIAAEDVAPLALGSGILACGGGGSSYYSQLVATEVLATTDSVEVISAEEMEPGTVALVPAGIGAPLIGLEKPLSTDALLAAYSRLERSIGSHIGGIIAGEIGGAQSLVALVMAALTGKPLLDGDGMGRAFPEMQMCTFLIYGVSPGLPTVLCDDHGLLWAFPKLPFGKIRFGGTRKIGARVGMTIERIFRRYCVKHGGWIYLCATLDKDSVAKTMVRGSIRQALEIGQGVQAARASQTDPIEAILRTHEGTLLLTGKIIDVQRTFRGGHDWGTLQIEGIGNDRKHSAELDFKNEYLVMRRDGKPVVTVPDLITVVETSSGTPINSEIARIGTRVSILGMPCSELYRSEAALRVVGPQAFGYDLPYLPFRSATSGPDL
jgi:hypothetical protein